MDSLMEGSPAKRPCPVFEPLPTDTASCLPRPVLEHVFAYVSCDDLVCCQCVCKAWDAVISHPQYRKFSKLYARYVRGEKGVVALVNRFTTPLYAVSPSNCLAFVVRAVKDWAADFAPDSAWLRRLPSFDVAKEYMSAFPQDANSSWPLLAAMVYLSACVSDVLAIVNAAIHHSVFTDRIVDKCHGLALIFLSLERNIRIPPRYHYNILYALKSVGKLRTEGKRLTAEQEKILRHRPGVGDVFKVTAYAGTGKTYTLEEFVKRNASRQYPVLYVSFNKSVREEAEMRFRAFSGVECKTLHSLVYEAYRFDLKLQYPSRPAVAHALKLGSCGAAAIIISAVKTFVNSCDAAVSLRHLPMNLTYHFDDNSSALMEEANNILPPDLVNGIRDVAPQVMGSSVAIDLANRLWDIMKSPVTYHSELVDYHLKKKSAKPRTLFPFSTAVAVKLFQLDEIEETDKRHRFRRFSCILVDEAQDFTACAMDTLLRQRAHSGLVLVGDPNQTIYQFTDVRPETFVNIAASRNFSLTESFRFGPNVAFVSSLLLRGNRGNGDGHLIGLPPNSVEDSLDGVCDSVVPGSGAQLTILATQNLTLLDYMLSDFLNPRRNDLKVFARIEHIMTKLKDLRAVHRLFADMNSPSSKTQAQSRSIYLCLRQAAAPTAYFKKFSVVEKHHLSEGFEDFLHRSKWEEVLHFEERTADVILSTVHMAKGKTLDHVILAPDVLSSALSSIEGPFSVQSLHMDVEALNMAYVACSRARHSLVLSKGVRSFLEQFDRRSKVVTAAEAGLGAEIVAGAIAAQGVQYALCQQHSTGVGPRICVMGHRYPWSTISRDPASWLYMDCQVEVPADDQCVICTPARVYAAGCLLPPAPSSAPSSVPSSPSSSGSCALNMMSMNALCTEAQSIRGPDDSSPPSTQQSQRLGAGRNSFCRSSALPAFCGRDEHSDCAVGARQFFC